MLLLELEHSMDAFSELIVNSLKLGLFSAQIILDPKYITHQIEATSTKFLDMPEISI